MSDLQKQSKPMGWWVDAGLLEYGQAWQLQLALVEKRRLGLIPDVLLLCEHPPVVTVGRRLSGRSNILTEQFPVYEVERGGDATYHGPGQLVGYPIIQFQPHETDPHQILRSLEKALCGLCQECGVAATSKEKHTGVWTADRCRKLASLGIALRNNISFHGFALNVTTDLQAFQAIHPCGLPSSVMTSVQAEGGALQGNPVAVKSLLEKTALWVGDALQRTFIARPLDQGVG